MRLLIFLITIVSMNYLIAQKKSIIDLSKVQYQKYEYRYLNQNIPDAQIVFKIKALGEDLFLEVDTFNELENISTNTSKYNLNSQEDLTRLKDYLENSDNIIVVDELKNTFRLNTFSILKKSNTQSYSYSNWKYKFEVNDNIRMGQNSVLNLQKGGGQIDIMDSQTMECLNTTVIRQYYSSDNNTYSEICIHPDLGVIRESNKNNFGETNLELYSINNQILDLYIRSICNSNQPIEKELLAKGSDPERQTHTVKKGETLYQIAKRYNLETEFLMKLNGLKNSGLNIGDILFLTPFVSYKEQKPLIETNPEMFEKPVNAPRGRVGDADKNALIDRGLPSKFAAQSRNSNFIIERKIHYVISGETLYSIAKKYKTSVSILISLNNLDKDNPQIKPDQKLFID